MKTKSKVLKPLTAKTWKKKFEIEFGHDIPYLGGYIECVSREKPVLEKIANTAKNFEELKEQILKFTKQQGDFIEAAHKEPDYGLPYNSGPE